MVSIVEIKGEHKWDSSRIEFKVFCLNEQSGRERERVRECVYLLLFYLFKAKIKKFIFQKYKIK
jgi:hypothetical protein